MSSSARQLARRSALLQVVVLSPDAQLELEEVADGHTYIVGGLVDRTVHKNQTLFYAAEHGYQVRVCVRGRYPRLTTLQPLLAHSGGKACKASQASGAARAACFVAENGNAQRQACTTAGMHMWPCVHNPVRCGSDLADHARLPMKGAPES